MIRIDRLTKCFGAQRALDSVSLDIGRGECFALLGPNGSGKTTMLKCLAGLAHPSSGSLWIDGADLRADGTRARRAISYLPQQAGFPEHLRVREVLEFYRRLRRLPPGRVDEVLELVDCSAFADRPVSELSGGMRQRLAIAVVCLPDAPVLLLDEPTASLDPESAARFRAILAHLKATGTTVMFATHVLADVEALADRIAILVDGKLLAVDTMAGLRSEIGSQRRLSSGRAGAQLIALDDIYLRYMHAKTVADRAAGHDGGVHASAVGAR